GVNSLPGAVKYPDSAGGFYYEESGKLLSVTSNRFIHWTTSGDALQLVEQSLDTNLLNNAVRLRIVNCNLLPGGVHLQETHSHVIILIVTNQSVHRLVLPHPARMYRSDQMCLMVADMMEYMPVNRDVKHSSGQGHKLRLSFSPSTGLCLGVYLAVPKRGQETLIDFSLTSTDVWALWQDDENQTIVKYINFEHNQAAQWNQVFVQPPPAEEVTVGEDDDPRLQGSVTEHEFSREEYRQLQVEFWSKFYACCLQYQEALSSPLALHVNPCTAMVCLLKKGYISFLIPCFAVDHLYLCSEGHLSNEEQETPITDGGDNVIEDVQNKMQAIQNPVNAMTILLREMNYEIETPMEDNLGAVQPLNVRMSLSQLFGSSAAVHLVGQAVCQNAMTRFLLCRDLLILQQLYLYLGGEVYFGGDGQLYQLQQDLVSRTSHCLCSYYLVREANLQHLSVLDMSDSPALTPNKSAGTVMFEYGMRLGREVRTLNGLQKQVNCYLCALNCLRLIRPEYAWIVQPASGGVYERPGASPKRNYDGECAANPAGRQIEILELKDLQKEYILARNRMTLAQHDPNSAAIAGNASAVEMVALLVQTGLFDTALSLCQTFKLSLSPVFEGLAFKCIKLQYGGEAIQSEAWDWLAANQLSSVISTKESSTTDEAWRLLSSYLEQYKCQNGQYHRCVINKLLSHGVPIPNWLVNCYKASPMPSETGRASTGSCALVEVDAAGLLRLYLNYDLLEEAVELVLEFVDALLGKGHQYFGIERPLSATAPLVWLPYLAIDQLLQALGENQSNINNANLYQKLQDKLTLYYKHVSQATIRRQQNA
ncbi:UNVERIFIED_CONTAM: hypothetical protein FKN15_006200, partial [Acipenser sinensis]